MCDMGGLRSKKKDPTGEKLHVVIIFARGFYSRFTTRCVLSGSCDRASFCVYSTTARNVVRASRP